MENTDLQKKLLTWLENKKPLVYEKYKNNIDVRDEKIFVNNKDGITEEEQNILTGLIAVFFSENPE